MGNRSSQNELPTRSTTTTQTFIETCVLHVDHKALEEHLVNNPVQQGDLDRCLLSGLQLVQQKESELSHVAWALKMLLQSGARWNSKALLEEQKTPYHIICESPGDHHELLNLMIKSSKRTIINTQDSRRCTAVFYAVQNANINCLKCLIANRANVNIADGRFYRHFVPRRLFLQWTPIMQAIKMLSDVTHTTAINVEIFDLLLDNGADVNTPSFMNSTPILLALRFPNVYCIKKLITKGARLDIIDNDDNNAWSIIAGLGKVELLKSMFEHGINKNSTDQKGFSILWHVVSSGNIEAVRYLLDLGVNIPSYKPKQSKQNISTCMVDSHQDSKYPCMRAIQLNRLEIVKVLEEYENQSCKTFAALRHAVKFGSVDVVSYLLNKYTYPVNMEYTIDTDQNRLSYTLLTEFIYRSVHRIIKLLLDHGADPTQPTCSATCDNAIMTAIALRNLKVIAQYIRSGVNINIRSYGRFHGKVLPFEASVLRGYYDVAEMLLLSGCSCGAFSLDNNHMFENNINPNLEQLMKEWKVQENNVTPLKQRCRCVILNHLYPRADEKILKLPLPVLLMKFLGISLIDDIVHK